MKRKAGNTADEVENLKTKHKNYRQRCLGQTPYCIYKISVMMGKKLIVDLDCQTSTCDDNLIVHILCKVCRMPESTAMTTFFIRGFILSVRQ